MGVERTIEMRNVDLGNRARFLGQALGDDPEEVAIFLARQEGFNATQAEAMAFQAVNPAARNTGAGRVDSAVREAQQERALNRAAWARAGETEFAHLPGIGGVVRSARDLARRGGSAIAISQAAAAETETREFFSSRGLPYHNADPETVEAVREAVTGSGGGRTLRGATLPTAPQLAGPINALLGLTGGNRQDPGDVMRRAHTYDVYWANQKSTTYSQRIVDDMKKKRSSDDAGMRRKVQDLMDNVEGDPTKTRGRVLDIVRGTALEKAVRAEGAAPALRMIGGLAEAYGIENRLGVASFGDRLIRYEAGERDKRATAAIAQDPIAAKLDSMVEPVKKSKNGRVSGEVGRVDMTGDSNEALASLLAKLSKNMDTISERLTRGKHPQL
jgi:hypothetical protein